MIFFDFTWTLIEVLSLKKQRETSHALSCERNPLVESSEVLDKGSILGSQQQENSTWRITHLNSTSIQMLLHITKVSPYTFKRQHSTWEVDIRNFALLFGAVNLNLWLWSTLPSKNVLECDWNSSFHTYIWIKLVKIDEATVAYVCSSL